MAALCSAQTLYERGPRLSESEARRNVVTGVGSFSAKGLPIQLPPYLFL
jgi:hypothetical protein